MTVLKTLINPLLYMFLFIAAGFVLRKRKVLPDNAAAVLSRLESDFIIPGVVLNSFIRYCTFESIKAYAKPMLLSLFLEILLILLSGPLSKLFVKDGYYRNVYRYELIYPNWGFLGSALVQTLYGAEGLYHFMLFALPMSIGCYLYGVPLLTPQEKGTPVWWKKLLTPSMIAVVSGTALGLAGFGKIMPPFLSDALSVCRTMFGPLGMLLTGVVIGGFAVKELFLDKKSYLMCLLRMVLIPSVFLVLAYLAGADTYVMQFVLFLHAVPLGLFPVVYPPRYGKDSRPGASMGLISNLLSLLTLPLFYVLLMQLLGPGT